MDNDKVVIIHPDGTTEHIGDFHDEEEFHSACLLDYALQNYSDADIFKKLNYRHKAETIAYFLTLLGDVIIINDSDNKLKYGKSGWILVPNEITNEEITVLYSFANILKDYNVKLTYDMNIDTGILAGHTLYDNEKNFKKVLDSYFDIINTKKSTR